MGFSGGTDWTPLEFAEYCGVKVRPWQKVILDRLQDDLTKQQRKGNMKVLESDFERGQCWRDDEGDSRKILLVHGYNVAFIWEKTNVLICTTAKKFLRKFAKTFISGPEPASWKEEEPDKTIYRRLDWRSSPNFTWNGNTYSCGIVSVGDSFADCTSGARYRFDGYCLFRNTTDIRHLAPWVSILVEERMRYAALVLDEEVAT